MTTVAVIAHSGKTLGPGLGALRELLVAEGVDQPLWFEVAKSKQVPRCAVEALASGADLIFVWGGDGTVQRCVDAVAGKDVTLAILPAGTANLLARNLGVPVELEGAVRVGLHGDRRAIDTGTVNGEHFAVMAGAGLDALMIDAADAGLKDRIGRAAYLWTGAKNLDASPVHAVIDVEGRRFFKGTMTCLLVGNVGKVLGGMEVFDGSRPDDGLLEFGVVTAKSRTQWLRTLGRVVAGRAQKSPFVSTMRGTKLTATFDQPTAYELDGGARGTTTKLKVKVRPASVTVCVPSESQRAELGQAQDDTDA